MTGHIGVLMDTNILIKMKEIKFIIIIIQNYFSFVPRISPREFRVPFLLLILYVAVNSYSLTQKKHVL